MDQMLPAGTWTADSAPSSLSGTKHTPKDRAGAFPHPQTLLAPNILVSSPPVPLLPLPRAPLSPGGRYMPA